MARIALIAGFAVAGALTGGLAWAGFLGFGIGGSALGAILLGAGIGGMVGQLAASLLPGQPMVGPRLQDTQVSSSANGAPIPFLYGAARFAGQIIWSTGIIETATNSSSGKGAPSQSTTTYSYTTSFAACFCEGPANVLQVWGDAKLIYDVTGKGAIAADVLATGIGTNTKLVVPKIYPGSSTQLPDPTIQAARGINATPAYRYRCYIVYENFPLADFGNRLPNIRGLCVSSTVLAYVKDTYGQSGILDPVSNGYDLPEWPYVSPVAREAVVFDSSGYVVETIDLNTSNITALGAWIANTAFSPGAQILDPGGNVQVVYSISGDGKTGGTIPTFTGLEGDVTSDHHVQWQNVGPGPNGIPITAKGALIFKESSSDSFAGSGQMPFCAGVDSQGYIWHTAFVTVSGVTHAYMYKFDPRTFKPVNRIDLGPLSGTVLSYSFAAVNGRNIVVAVTSRSYSDTGKIYFLDGASGGIIGESLVAGVATTSYTTGFGTPAIDKNGVAYSVWVDSVASPWAYVVYVYDSRSGGAEMQSHFFNGDATHGTPRSVVWSSVDNSLILFTNLGAIVKIDVATMAILATTVPGMFYVGGDWYDLAGKAYNGQAPTTGLIYLPAGSAAGVNSNTHFLTFDCTAFAEVSRVLQGDWFALSSNWQGISFLGYDIPTHSIVVGSSASSAYANSSFRIYLDRQTVAGETLDQVVLNIMTRANLDPSLIDVTALASDIVFGYPVTANSDAKNILTPLAAAYFFDIVESDFKLRCVPRGGASVISIPEADLGLLADGFEVKPTFAQEADLPKSVEVMYADPALDYQTGKQGKRRHARVVKTKNKTILQLPLTMQSDAAMAVAVKALQVFWDERNTYTFNLYSAKYQIIDPSDVVTLTYKGKAYAARLTKTTSGLDFSLQVEAVSEDPRNYITAQKGSGAGSFVSPVINPAPNTILFVLDIGLLQDQDASVHGSTGYYDAMSAATLGWPGGALFSSTDNETYAAVDYSNVSVPYGIVGAAIPAPARPFTTFDYSTVINVRMAAGQTLSSCTMAQLLSGANACLIGTTQYIYDPRLDIFGTTHQSHVYELLQFKNATLQADGSYNLDTLIRGQRGTEWTIGMHLPGETFIFLNAGGIDRKSAATSIVGINDQYYKGVTIGSDVASTPTLAVQHHGMDLRPYAVCHVAGSRDPSHNLTITWVRRTRVGGDGLLDGIDTVPLSEDSELYEIDVFDPGGDLHGQYTTTTTTFVYTAAMQAADLYAPASPIHLRIYQVSAQIGVGIAWEGIL